MLICCLKALSSLSPAGNKDFIFLGSVLQGLCSTIQASPLLLCYIRLTETAQACWWFPLPLLSPQHSYCLSPANSASSRRKSICPRPGNQGKGNTFLWEFNEVDFQCTEFRCLWYVWIERSKEQFMSMDLSIRKVSRGDLWWNWLTCTEYY